MEEDQCSGKMHVFMQIHGVYIVCFCDLAGEGSDRQSGLRLDYRRELCPADGELAKDTHFLFLALASYQPRSHD